MHDLNIVCIRHPKRSILSDALLQLPLTVLPRALVIVGPAGAVCVFRLYLLGWLPGQPGTVALWLLDLFAGVAAVARLDLEPHD